MSKVSINGRMLPARAALISVYDRSYLYGEGVFETLRAYGGRVAFVPEHFQRLKANCARVAIALPFDVAGFARALQRTLDANHRRNAMLRVTLSPVGRSPNLRRPADCRTNVVILTRPLPPRNPRRDRRGADLILVRSVVAEAPAIATIKSTSYLTRMLARLEVQRANADEGLLATARGNIVEGTATNLFLVRRQHLYTPPISDGALPGVTRHVVLRLAQQLGIRCHETHITTQHLRRADELFLTGSSTELLPIRHIRGLTTKHTIPGHITQQLMSAYRRVVLQKK